jgi:hypothetical protein
MLRLLPASPYTATVDGFALGYAEIFWSVSIPLSLLDRRFNESGYSRKWK